LPSAKSKRRVRIILAEDGWVKAVNGDDTVDVLKYLPDRWLSFAIEVDTLTSKFLPAIG